MLTKLPPGPPLVAAGADAGVEYMADGDGDGAGAGASAGASDCAGALVVALN